LVKFTHSGERTTMLTQGDSVRYECSALVENGQTPF
jgi:hypothetical protein